MPALTGTCGQTLKCTSTAIDISCVNQTSWWIHNPCPGHSTGSAGLVFRQLVNTILASQCALANPCTYPDDYGPYFATAQCDCAVTFDFIIVGGGTAGSIIANRLSEVSTWKILVLEAGGDPPITVEVPELHLTLQNTCIDWMFKTMQNLGIYHGMIEGQNNLPAGRVLGGSSSIGRMIYNRGNRIDYDCWAKKGNTGWSYKEVLHYFKKSENMLDKTIMQCPGLSQYHGIGGYLTIDLFKGKDSLICDLMNVAKEMGYDDIKDPDGLVQSGYHRTHGTIRDGERMNMAKAFLSPVRTRPNLFVIKHAYVTKLLICPQSKRVYAVEFRLRRECCTRIARVRREVVLSAGVYNTPKILMLSGIGRACDLQKHNIPVISDLNVGCNLQDHVTFPGVVMTLNLTCVNENTDLIRLDAVYEYLTRRTGNLATIHESEVIGFIGVDSDDIPDLMMYHKYIRKSGFKDLDSWANTLPLTDDVYDLFAKMIKDKDILITMPVLLRPRSRGFVNLACCDPFNPPFINPKHFVDPLDVERMLSGIQFVMMMAESTRLRHHEAELKRLDFPGCCEEMFGTDEYWACALSFIGTTWNEASGTASMGTCSDPNAVVTPLLLVRGVKGLRIADASVMPSIPGGGTLAPVAMIAEKTSNMIKKAWLTLAQIKSLTKKGSGIEI